MLKRKKIEIDHLDYKISQFAALKMIQPPPLGWIRGIRTALNMSLRQLSQKLGINVASISELELRELEGSITIRKMKEVARAMDMEFVYGLIPNEGSLKAMIAKRAKEMAREIVLRTDQNMKLEDQSIPEEKIQKAIDDRAQELENEIPKLLWE